MGCIRGTGCRLPVLSPLPAGMIAFSRWIGCSTLSVSGKGGYMSRNSFQKRRLVPSPRRRFCQRWTFGKKTKEALKGCPLRAGRQGEPQEYRFASASLLFGLG